MKFLLMRTVPRPVIPDRRAGRILSGLAKTFFIASLFVLSLLEAQTAFAGISLTNEPPDFAALDLDQLASIKIVSVTKREEPLQDAPAAVHVVTGDDIARSGATSIPEALRSVPGLNVAQINGTTLVIGARGFQSEYAAKLLVMLSSWNKNETG